MFPLSYHLPELGKNWICSDNRHKIAPDFVKPKLMTNESLNDWRKKYIPHWNTHKNFYSWKFCLKMTLINNCHILIKWKRIFFWKEIPQNCENRILSKVVQAMYKQ